MKVTVCFRDIKVVVPCGDGNGLVKDILEEAIARYRKARSKNADSNWLTPKTVKLLLSDGGILDPDDKINDVIDDKEQIQAVLDGNHCLLEGQNDNNGDGRSGSSIGTSSPDIFHDNITHRICSGKEANGLHGDDRHDVLITEQDFLTESGLRVRRDSEPVLCTSSDLESSYTEVTAEFPVYSVVKSKGAVSRKEPLGSMSASGLKYGHLVSSGKMTAANDVPVHEMKDEKKKENSDELEKEIIVVLPKSSEALGIHVVPAFDNTGRNEGLLIEKVEQGGRADRDGRLKQGDKITEINFQNLFGVDFSKAQDIFRSAFLAPELQVKLCRLHAPPGHLTQQTNQGDLDKTENSRKIPPAVPARNPKTQLSTKVPDNLTMQTIVIELHKGPQGLGFSVTTHGNVQHESSPIYIKNIFSEGAAVEDGRMRPGDVILEINGVSLADKKKVEAVRMLRGLPKGSTVQLVISRALTHQVAHQANQPREVLNKQIPRPLSTLGFFPSSTSSYSDKTEEEEEADGEEGGGNEHEDATGVKEIITDSQNDEVVHSVVRNGFGSMSDLNHARESDDESNSPHDLTTDSGQKPIVASGQTSTLQKSRKSISMDDLRHNFKARSGVEPSFDDDVDYPAAPFRKTRNFNQSFRAAVIDKNYNDPNAATRTVKYPASKPKVEKLKRNDDKKNKNKKEGERGSGRKFAWLFRFGKGKKSDDERDGSGFPENQAKDAEKIRTKEVPPITKQFSGHRNGHLPPSSHSQNFDNYPPDHGRHIDISGRGLYPQKENPYQSVPPQQTVLPRTSPVHLKPQSPDVPRKVDASYPYIEHRGSHYGQAYPQTAIAAGRDDLIHRQLAQSAPQNFLDYMHRSKQLHLSHLYPEKNVMPEPSRQYYRQENSRAYGGYYRDNDPIVPAHQKDYRQPSSPQFFAVESNRGYYWPNEQRPVARSEHYYHRDNVGRPDSHLYNRPSSRNWDYYQQPDSRTQGPMRGEYPMDLSRYAAGKSQDRREAGYRSQEFDGQAGFQMPSDLQVPKQTFSAYPPYKEINPYVDFHRVRDIPTKNSRTTTEQIKTSDLYQSGLRQNPTSVPSSYVSGRW